jgi:hypothetical protein
MVPVSYMLVRVQKKDGTKTVNGGGDCQVRCSQGG